MCRIQEVLGSLMVKQFQLTCWPAADSLPASPDCMVALFDKVQRWQQISGDGLITVHCRWAAYVWHFFSLSLLKCPHIFMQIRYNAKRWITYINHWYYVVQLINILLHKIETAKCWYMPNIWSATWHCQLAWLCLGQDLLVYFFFNAIF